VEAVHAAVLGLFRRTGARPQTTGLTGWVYRTVRRITRLSGRVAARLLGEVENLSGPLPRPDTGARRRLLSVLNGVLGDHLVASGSPLARAFSVRTPEGPRVDLGAIGPAAPDTLIVFVHGLCLDDRAWTPEGADRPGLVEALPAVVDGLPVLVRYNTGRSVRGNGRALSAHLGRLDAPPRGPGRIVLVAHSMGGLVARSAAAHARRTSASWPARVTEAVYLGTPHRGAPLERAGAWVEAQLRRTPITAPFASLATLRSQGIQDLRHGSGGAASEVLAGRDLHVAGALGAGRSTRAVIGDGLVPVPSALGASGPSARTTRRVFEGVGHLQLLRSPVVTEHLCRWLSRGDRR
jgi:pimeloyl-ACP methyl ester carboxylesterase